MIKQGGGKLGSEEWTLHVDLKYLLVLLFRCFKYGCTGLDAGVVHHDVQPAESFHRGGDQPFQVGEFAHVRIHADGLIAKRCYRPFEFLGPSGWET